MNGVSMEELRELISYSHEAEFEYKGREYVIQPECSDQKDWLVIWVCSGTAECLVRHEIPKDGDIPQDIIQKVLEEKCFDGKSFLEIEKDVTVTAIL